MTQESTLEPCPNPWCDGKSPYGIRAIRGSYGDKPWKVACTSCDLVGPDAASEAEAIAAWNRRTPPQSETPMHELQRLGQEFDASQSEALVEELVRAAYTAGAIANGLGALDFEALSPTGKAQWYASIRAILPIIDRERAAARREGIEEAARVMENLCFFTDINEQLTMTKQDMSVRTCHEGAKAIRALAEKQP